MATERKSYTEEFKREAVRLMENSGKPVAQLARDLGINDNNLYRWRERYGSQAQTRTSGSVVEMETELKRLRRETRCCGRSVTF
jgi:transposase